MQQHEQQTIACELCGEEIYAWAIGHHMAKDHDPEVERELELVEHIIAEYGLGIDTITELVYG
jgi:hypothetical protein